MSAVRRPLPEPLIRVQDSPLHGQGVFAARRIQRHARHRVSG